ncbi:hypothetical protein GOP47_0010880 [Adiantum capillus-veneris]|uniref:Uncharacterized protein n=1 Tax=Adiantum capillus-veneris TaxID=13818 RepID=A0A9D4ZGT8_ADICA|nr:hypothetical protein GOP47_0010880 [Adiantum capillus-veneris]
MTAVASAGMLRHCKHNELYRGCWSCRFHIKDLCLGNLHPCGPLCGSLNTKHQARTLDSRSCWLHYQRPHSGWQAVPGYYRTIRENPDLSGVIEGDYNSFKKGVFHKHDDVAAPCVQALLTWTTLYRQVDVADNMALRDLHWLADVAQCTDFHVSHRLQMWPDCTDFCNWRWCFRHLLKTSCFWD